MIVYSAPGVPVSALDGVTAKYAIKDGFVLPHTVFYDWEGDECDAADAMGSWAEDGEMSVTCYIPPINPSVH